MKAFFLSNSWGRSRSIGFITGRTHSRNIRYSPLSYYILDSYSKITTGDNRSKNWSSIIDVSIPEIN